MKPIGRLRQLRKLRFLLPGGILLAVAGAAGVGDIAGWRKVRTNRPSFQGVSDKVVPADTEVWVNPNARSDSGAVEVRDSANNKFAFPVANLQLESTDLKAKLGPNGQKGGDCIKGIDFGGSIALPTRPVPTPDQGPNAPGTAPAEAAPANPGSAVVTPVSGGNTSVAEGAGPGGPSSGASLPANGDSFSPAPMSIDPGTVQAITDEAKGVELFQAAKERQRIITDSAASDMETLAGQYRNLSMENFGAKVDRAISNLNDTVETFENLDSKATAKGGLDPSEQVRFRNLFMNARDKAMIAKDIINEGEKEKTNLLSTTPLGGIASGQIPNPLARSASLADLFGGDTLKKNEATTQDALVNRTLMFQGLDPKQKAQVQDSMKLVHSPLLAMNNGQTRTLPILHNGYIFGGGGSSVDCSSFITQALPAELRKTRYTTLDFRSMWIYRKTGMMPLPPRYTSERAKTVRDAADAFIPVNIYAGEKLMVGDLLVYRVSFDPAGHVFLVKGFNPSTLQVQVLEASQSAGTVRERDFPLSADSPNAKERLIRPGLLALRLKPGSNRGCSYVDAKTGKRKEAGL